jgi:uncharacterized protein GlcG (DUF336 family)
MVFALVMQAALGQVPGGPGGQVPGNPGGQAPSSAVTPGVVRTDVVTLRALTHKYSMQAAQAALNACASTDPHIAVVVVDTAGNPRLIMVADGAKSSLVDHATRKGFTAAALRQVTSVEQKIVAANPQMVIPPQGQNLIEPGGVPIRAGTQVIGGIGVEGGDPMEAEKCAQAGVNSLKDDLHPESPAPNGPRAQ